MNFFNSVTGMKGNGAELFFDGLADKEQTIDRLGMEKPNMQMCFRTGRALERLKFLGGVEFRICIA